MRHLYVAFAVLLLILLTPIAGFAQRNNAKQKDVITRTIIGCTLGETTLEQLKEKVKEQGGGIHKIEDGEEGPRVQVLYASGVKFFGKIQDFVIFKTVDGVFYAVAFVITEKDEADRLKRSLPDKYEGWENTHTPIGPCNHMKAATQTQDLRFYYPIIMMASTAKSSNTPYSYIWIKNYPRSQVK